MTRALRNLAVVLAFAAAACGAGEGLADRIRRVSDEVRDLEALYRAASDADTRVTALELMMQRSVWLEQVGGMKDAVADHCLALARLEGFAQAAPLRHGYLAESDGSPVAEAQVRRPRAGELPERLAPLAKRILYLNVRNATSGPLDLAAVQVELRRFGETKKEGPANLPENLQGLAPLFALPERLAPGDEKQCMLLLGEGSDAVASLAVPVRQEGQEAARTLRVAFPETTDPDGMLAARKKAAAIEKQILAWRETQVAEAAKKEKPEPAKVPKADPPPNPDPKVEPKKEAEDETAIGTVERAGAGVLIQVRLKSGKAFMPNEVLRVRKDGKWVGKIKVPEGVAVNENKEVYWMSIVGGDRDTLAGGTLHHEE